MYTVMILVNTALVAMGFGSMLMQTLVSILSEHQRLILINLVVETIARHVEYFPEGVNGKFL